MLPYFKKILCPTDFSKPSIEALKVADDLAQRFDAELYLVHVITPLPSVPGPPISPTGVDVAAYLEKLEESARKSLHEIADQKISSKIQTHQITANGDPADQIVRITKEEGIELVVIATRGQSGLEHFLFGSVAEKVVRLSPAPVLSIRVEPDEHQK